MIGIEKIDHICVAVRDLEAAIKTWALFLGKDKPDLEYELDAEAIKVVRYYVGEVGWELMVSTRENSDVDRFIKKHGEGITLVSSGWHGRSSAMSLPVPKLTTCPLTCFPAEVSARSQA